MDAAQEFGVLGRVGEGYLGFGGNRFDEGVDGERRSIDRWEGRARE